MDASNLKSDVWNPLNLNRFNQSRRIALLAALAAITLTTPCQAVVTGNHKGVPVHHIHSADSVEFASNAIHVIHASAATKLEKLTIRNLKNAQIHFLGPIKAKVATESQWQVDRGVVNLIGCEKVVLSGLKAENLQRYQPVVGLGKNESTAVSIAHSKKITIKNAELVGDGKGVVVVSGGSSVTIKDSKVKGYYFELQVGASTVHCRNTTFDQFNEQVGDSHAAIWVSSSMRSELDNQFFENSRVTFKGCTFNMKSGRALLSGNGSYASKSKVIFHDVPKINHKLSSFGFVIFHQNYHSILVELRKQVPNLVDLVRSTSPTTDLGRFVMYHQSPGKPSDRSPIVVDGLSSESINP